MYLMASTGEQLRKVPLCSGGDGEITPSAEQVQIWSLPNCTRWSVYNGQYEIGAIASCGNGVWPFSADKTPLIGPIYSPDCPEYC